MALAYQQARKGLANKSGALGRHWARTPGLGAAPQVAIQKKAFHQKTFAINSFYHSGPDSKYPMGVIQAAGNIEPIGLSRRFRYFADFAAATTASRCSS